MAIHVRRSIAPAMVLALSIFWAPRILCAQQHASDAQIQADAHKQLSNKRFKDVQIEVHDGVVRLTGQVDRYADKSDAESRVAKMHEASSIQNEITVAGGGNVSDAALYQKLAKGLTYDREGYGTQTFNNITLQVHDGVVVLGGSVVEPADKDSALGLVKNTAGVRDVIDHLQVDPVSPMDWRIRRAEEQAIYGYPQLNRYALNPAKPIRIIVQNGHVTLDGVVDSSSDREIAGMRANGVPGVFSVQNNLQVAGAER